MTQIHACDICPERDCENCYLNHMDDEAEGDNDTDCEYCHEDSDGYVFPLEKSGHALVRFGMDGWTLSVKYGTWRKNIRINYCPMCGRRLKHE